MIFVTVGTHEQQFNRLVKYMDGWAKNHDEEVVIQTGFSTYEPKYAKWQKLFGYSEMQENINKARIVITHGGPSSFIAPLQVGKTPIVVPRQRKYGEHINDHQVRFCREVYERQHNIILVDEVDELAGLLDGEKKIITASDEAKSNNSHFCEELAKIVDEIMK